MKFLKKSVAPEPEPEQQPEPVKVATVSEDSMDASIGVIIQINVKTSNDVIDNVAKEGITIKVNDKAISLETSASVEESQKFVDDLQQAVSQDATTKQEDEEPQKDHVTIPSVLDKLMFWKSKTATADKPAKEEEEKKEETVSEESKPEEETVEKKEEVEPVADAETEAPKEETAETKEAEPAAKTEAEALQEESVEKKEEAEPSAEAEAPKEQEESSSPFSFLQSKLTFWQDEATKEQKEEEPVAEEVKAKAAEAQVEVEVEQKEVEEEAFSHKIEVFVDGAAIQTIRLTNAGMDHLKNFIASVQEEARLKGEEVAVTQAWLAEKMSEFFESAKVQGDAVVSSDEAAPTTPSDAAPIKEETTAEVETQPAAKRSWWPFSSNATETTEEKAVDEARNETAEVEVKEDATEQTREVAEAA